MESGARITILSQSYPGEYAGCFLGLLHALEDVLDAPVDLITYNALRKKSLKAHILKERIAIYE